MHLVVKKMSFDAVMPPYNASDPTASFLGSSCLDLLLIELVPMAYRVVNELDGQAAASDSAAGAGAQQLPTPPPEDRHQSSSRTNGADPAAAASGAGDAAARRAAGGGGGVVGRMDEEEQRDAVFFRLEALGYRVGQGLVER